MFRWFDRSSTISRVFERTSSGLARRRGLPIVIGVLLIALSFVVQLINLAAPSAVLDWLWTLTHHVGLIVALVGILLMEPLGK